MKLPKLLAYESIPCWTKLIWQSDPPAIEIMVHEEAIGAVVQLHAGLPFIKEMEKKFGAITLGRGADWGFEASLKHRPTQDGFASFRFELPKVEETKPCHRCGGSGKDPIISGRCMSCQDGKESDYRWERIIPAAASVALLTDLVGRFPPENGTSSKTPQLLSVTTVAASFYGVFGSYGPELTRWLRAGGVRELPEMAEAMIAAWRMMCRKDEYDERHIWARVAYDSGWLNASCPGDACGIHPVTDVDARDPGYEFTCHNVDSPM